MSVVLLSSWLHLGILNGINGNKYAMFSLVCVGVHKIMNGKERNILDPNFIPLLKGHGKEWTFSPKYSFPKYFIPSCWVKMNWPLTIN